MVKEQKALRKENCETTNRLPLASRGGALLWLGLCFVGSCGPASLTSTPVEVLIESEDGDPKAAPSGAPSSSDAKADVSRSPEPAGDAPATPGGGMANGGNGMGDEVSDPGRTIEEEVASLALLQVKPVTLLRATLEECFGKSSSTLLRREMFAADSFLTPVERQAFEAKGRVKFVSVDSPYMRLVRVNTTGSGAASPSNVVFIDSSAPDVLELEKSRLEDLSSTKRGAAAADSLSDRYLRSLESIAQVVAHNCDLESQSCNCSTPELATAMIRRCLPLVDAESAQFQETAKQMATQCAAGAFETRQAIAALVSSYAFALRR